MKKTLLMTGALLALTAGLALAGAGGLNLGWGDCQGLPATLNRTFACNTNAGTINSLVGSYLAPSFVTAASANEIVVDIQSGGATLPAWWGMRASGTCRTTASLLINLDFTGGPFTCFDYWGGGASGGISEDPPVGNRARIKLLGALPAGSPSITGIAEGTETYSFKMNVNNAKTVGLCSCAGCLEGVCLVLNSIKINQAGGVGDKFVSAPATRNFATWQGGIPSTDCYGATPAKNTTWGSVKALYR